MSRSSLHKGSSLAIAAIFLASIALLVAGGMLLKLFLILRASSFDGTHQYVIEVDQNEKHGEIIAFSPSSQSVETLVVEGKVPNNLSVALHIPIDAKIVMPDVASPTKLVGDMLWHVGNEEGITIIDKIRLFLFINSLKPTDFHQTIVTFPIDALALDKLLSGLVLDNALYADNKTITVVNATGISGVAGDVAKMLTAVGMDVVSVTTADTNQNATTIVVKDLNSYTANRLSHFLHVAPVKGSGSVVSDITLTIGKDSLSQLQ